MYTLSILHPGWLLPRDIPNNEPKEVDTPDEGELEAQQKPETA